MGLDLHCLETFIFGLAAGMLLHVYILSSFFHVHSFLPSFLPSLSLVQFNSFI